MSRRNAVLLAICVITFAALVLVILYSRGVASITPSPPTTTTITPAGAICTTTETSYTNNVTLTYTTIYTAPTCSLP